MYKCIFRNKYRYFKCSTIILPFSSCLHTKSKPLYLSQTLYLHFRDNLFSMSTSFNLSLLSFFSLLPVFYVSPLIPDCASVHASIAMVLFSFCVAAWSRDSDTEINSSCLIPSPPPPPPPLPLLHCLIFMRERKHPPAVLPYTAPLCTPDQSW